MKLRINITETDQNIFFTSDFHFFHKNVLKYDNRPFKTVDEMHETIITNWNDVVNPNDIAIYLGDLAFVKNEELSKLKTLINRLNGKIHFIMGNHDDYNMIKSLNRFETINDLLELNIKHKDANGKFAQSQIVCMHYPIYAWNKSHHGVPHVHGHTHGNLHHGEDASYYVNRRVMDVGCMLHDYTPVSYLDVLSELNKIEIKKL